MVDEENRLAAEKQAGERFDSAGTLKDGHKKGQWFSNPQGGVRRQQNGAQVAALPAPEAVPVVPKKGAARKAVDVSEFDAW
jgi:hypothetical protein